MYPNITLYIYIYIYIYIYFGDTIVNSSINMKNNEENTVIFNVRLDISLVKLK